MKKGTKENNVSYHMLCGCILKKKDLVKKKQSRCNCCPIHFERILKKVGPCKTCGCALESIGGKPLREYCPSCKPLQEKKYYENSARAKKRKKAYKERIYKPTPVDFSISKMCDADRWDCVFWDTACGIKAIRENLKTRPCKGCRRYIKTAQNADFTDRFVSLTTK